MEFRRFNVIPLLLLLLLVFLQYRLWGASGGLVDMMHLKNRLDMEQQENDKLKKRNQLLVLQVKSLQKNQDAIESRARQELGMIRKGETFYQVVK